MTKVIKSNKIPNDAKKYILPSSPQEPVEDDRRLMIAYADRHDVLNMANKRLIRFGTHLCITIPQLPEGTKVEEVTYCFDNRAFKFLLQHPDFPIVPEGAFLPRYPWDITFEEKVYRVVGGDEFWRMEK